MLIVTIAVNRFLKFLPKQITDLKGKISKYDNR